MKNIEKDKENKYDFLKIENHWRESVINANAKDFSEKPKHYHLLEFPYPSGEGLHVGHCMSYGASDAYCRMKRMQGYNVLFPIGWDAFGLPTENFAIKHKIKPQDATASNIANFKKQMELLGYSFDWDREVNTTDPNYYKWTQWIFLQFYKHGIDKDGKLIEIVDEDTTTPRLAFQAEIPINWCPSCKIGLANEEVISGKCERCGTETERRTQKQWMLRITSYAERLLKDLDKVDYLPKIKSSQINWIGRSEGTKIKFEIRSSKYETNSKLENTQNVIPAEAGISKIPDQVRDDKINHIEVFTTRADTLFGITYIVLSPEHPAIKNLQFLINNYQEVEEYICKAINKSDLERTELSKEKTGVELKGVTAINPINGEEIPVWVADYVLANYGTGAVMAVPAHDERDWDFAKKYDLPIIKVIEPLFIQKTGESTVSKNHPTVERNAVMAIVKHWKEDKYLCLKWKKVNWQTLITGGAEGNQTAEEGAITEIKEETGYLHPKIVNELTPYHSLFFHNPKQVNRYAHFRVFYFELEDNEKVELSQDEKSNHEIIWLEKNEVTEFLTPEGHIHSWKEFIGEEKAYIGEGLLTNSNGFDGLTSEEAKKKITEKLKEIGAGDFTVNYKLRDWVFSRQHYWGEPMPIIYCRKCWENSNLKSQISKLSNSTILNGEEYAIVPVPKDQLPITLPDVENYEPTNTGESPLANITDWVNTTCPKCGGPAKRETDTMPNWAGSSWYFLAYAMKKNTSDKLQATSGKPIFEDHQKELKYWMPVDLYNGGMEHTNLHLLYSRFWHKFLYDLGCVPGPEPYQKRIAHGIILGPDGQKMSKSKGNVINPDDMAKKYGADAVRAYIMFIGPYDQESAWSTAGIQGVFRFLNRVYTSIEKVKDNSQDSKELLIKLNQTIAGVTDDLENMRLNTVVSKLMELNNTIEKTGAISKSSYEVFIKLLSVAAPFLAQELWSKLGHKEALQDEVWPKVDDKYLVAEKIEIVVQINGKVRDRIMLPPNTPEEKVKKAVLSSAKTKEYTEGKEIKKIIVIPNKLVSIVVG